MPYKDPEKQTEYLKNYRTDYMRLYRYRESVKVQFIKEIEEEISKEKLKYLEITPLEMQNFTLRTLVDFMMEEEFRVKPLEEQKCIVKKSIDYAQELTQKRLLKLSQLFDEQISKGITHIEEAVDAKFAPRLKILGQSLTEDDKQSIVQELQKAKDEIPKLELPKPEFQIKDFMNKTSQGDDYVI